MFREADVLVPNADSTLRAMLQLVLGSGFSALGGNGRSGGVQKSDGCEVRTHCHGFCRESESNPQNMIGLVGSQELHACVPLAESV